MCSLVRDNMPPQCCRYNGSGRCRACKRVREGRTCTGCTPGRSGRCENVGGPAPCQDATPHTQEAEPPAMPGERELDPGERCVVETMDAVRHDRYLPSNHTSVAVLPITSISLPSNSASQQPLPHCRVLQPRPLRVLALYLPLNEFQLLTFNGVNTMDTAWSMLLKAPTRKQSTGDVTSSSGKAGKDYVKEQARLLKAYSDETPLEQVALKAAMVMPLLLLQKPHPTSKTKEHVCCLERRMRVWSSGNIEELVREGTTIQQHLPQGGLKERNDNQRVARTFTSLIMGGKVRAALCLVSDHGSAGVLSLEEYIDGKPVKESTRLHKQHAQPPSYLQLTTQSRHIQSFLKGSMAI